MSPIKHHPLCNFWGTDPTTCRQCKGLRKESWTEDINKLEDHIEDRFPDAIIRDGTGAYKKCQEQIME